MTAFGVPTVRQPGYAPNDNHKNSFGKPVPVYEAEVSLDTHLQLYLFRNYALVMSECPGATELHT